MKKTPSGCIERLPSGRYRYRLPRSLGGGERQAGETCDTREEAAEQLRALLEHLRAQPRPEAGTLRAWGETWLAEREKRGLSSYAGDCSRWRQHVAQSDLADLSLSAIRPPHVLAWVRWLAERRAARQRIGGGRARDGAKLSRQTQQHCLKLVQLALADAVLEGLIPSNPAAEVSVVPEDEGDDLDAWTWLTLEEIAEVLRCERIPLPLRLLYAVAIFTGLRAGELRALRWERVRLEADRPQILVAKSNRRKSTKSGKPRAVPLLPPALQALRSLWETAGQPAEGLVFPGAGGRQRPMHDDFGWADRSRGVQGVQRGHRTLAGIRDGVRFHDLRHTCASHLLQGSWGRRWTLEEVRDFLGHSSITVTQRYAHLDQRRLHEAAAETPGSAPRLAPRAAPALSQLSSVGPVGFEPTTNGLKDSRTTKAYQGDNAAVVRSWCADGGESARAVVALAASGQMVPGVLLQGLAKAVLKSAAVRLAEQILQGGPFALDRALELAELVLQGEEAGGAVSTVDTAKPRAELARKRTA